MWTVLMVCEYLGFYSAKIRVGGLPRGLQARGAPLGRGREACGLLMSLLTPSRSLVGVFWSKKNHRKSFIPFVLRLIFLSEKVKNKEKK